MIIHPSVPGGVEYQMATVLCSDSHLRVESGSSPFKSGAGLVTFDTLDVAEMMSYKSSA